MDDEQLARRDAIVVLVVAAIVGLVLVSLGADRDPPPAVASSIGTPAAPTTTGTAPVTTEHRAPAVTTVTTTAPPSTVSTTASTTASSTDPGALPETDERPGASGATFTAGVEGLWQAVQQDRPELAMPFFFPKAAYLQVKAIADPASDYEQRLIADYEQDIHTLHAQLGAGAPGAQFGSIDVPDAQAVLVQPGEESNRLSYWRVYGTTLHYLEDGQARSFPVTSLISWRGQWYVVHLGEIR